MEEAMEEKQSLFGIEPVVKRAYHKSGKYRKANAKPKKRKRRKGLRYRKVEENCSFLSLAGYAIVRDQIIMDVHKGARDV
jgi:hypothetical protein